jgi:uncharacterized protein YjbJ (UPF0337 family)
MRDGRNSFCQLQKCGIRVDCRKHHRGFACGTVHQSQQSKGSNVGTKDKASNKAQDLKGKAREAVGSATGNKDLKAKGKADQTIASLKDVGEKVKDVTSNAKDVVENR